MPEDLTESVTGSTELLFPDDTTGKTYKLRRLEVYDADEVRDEMEVDVELYGKWMPVTVPETGLEGFLTAPSDLRTKLVQNDVQAGERFEILAMQKQGPKQSDPYRVEINFPDRKAVPDDQVSIDTATDGSGK